MPAKLNPEVTAYIAGQPAAFQPALNEVRQLIRTAYPKAEEGMYSSSGTTQTFPVYKTGEQWLGGFAVRARGPMVYMMDTEVVARYKPQLGTLAQGKGCVLYKPTKTLDPTQLKQLFATMLKEAAARRK